MAPLPVNSLVLLTRKLTTLQSQETKCIIFNTKYAKGIHCRQDYGVSLLMKKQGDRQTETLRQTDRQRDRWTDRDKETDRWIGWREDGKGDRQRQEK